MARTCVLLCDLGMVLGWTESCHLMMVLVLYVPIGAVGSQGAIRQCMSNYSNHSWVVSLNCLVINIC